MSNKKQVLAVMREKAEGCRDPRTGELNHTLLVEQTAEELGLYDGHDFEIEPELFDIVLNFK